MVPTALAQWTLKTVEDLCAAGQSEGDQHDFKLNLADARNVTKLCCAFANTFGGFIVLGVSDRDAGAGFDVIGLDADAELYGKLIAKVRASPDIVISQPNIIPVPSTGKLLYIFDVPQSPRRPHLPTPAEERIFWKRQGPSCRQMTLEEIRLQMINYEEKREKLALLLIDLSFMLRSLEEQSMAPDGHYNGTMFSFEIMDRVTVEAYSILREDIQSIGVMDTLRKQLQTLNAGKQKMLQIQASGASNEYKLAHIKECREVAKGFLPNALSIVGQIERSFKEKFGIENPYMQHY